MSIRIEISPGELFDRLTILEIKSDKLTDAEKLKNVRTELSLLEDSRKACLSSQKDERELTALITELRGINEALWNIEDEIRDCERDQNFGARFIELARSVYRTNDRRSAVKRRINELLGSRIIEEKSYAKY